LAEKGKEQKICDKTKKKTMRVYEFEWGHHSDERFLMEINATARVVEKLLDEYRRKDPDGYNNEGFAQFMISKGYEARLLEPEESFYF
jgi:hypothetical protein